MDIDNTKDLVFVNGACPVTSFPVETVAQRLFIRLRTFFSEWQFDTTYGVPYFQRILKKGVNKSSVDSILQDQILSEVGVARITEFNSEFNGNTRQYSLRFKVLTTAGVETETITINT